MSLDFSFLFCVIRILLICKVQRVLRESVPKKVQKKSGIPEEEKGVWGSQGEKGKFFFSMCLSQYNNVSCSKTCFSLIRTF